MVENVKILQKKEKILGDFLLKQFLEVVQFYK